MRGLDIFAVQIGVVVLLERRLIITTQRQYYCHNATSIFIISGMSKESFLVHAPEHTSQLNTISDPKTHCACLPHLEVQ